MADGWKGILPDDGVNPSSTDEKTTIVESELLSEKDQESLEAMDIATGGTSADAALAIE